MAFQSTQKTSEDVDNRHSKDCRSFDLDQHCNTFKILFRAVHMQGNGGACKRNRIRNTQLPNADTIDFFFWTEKKGGFVRTLRTPLGYVPELVRSYDRPPASPSGAIFILAGGHVRASAGALAIHTALILAGCHVRASAGDLAVHGALIRVCVCVCLSGIKLLSHHATNRDQVGFCRQVSTR